MNFVDSWGGPRMKIRFMYFSTLTIYVAWGHLFNKSIPILTELQMTKSSRVLRQFNGGHLLDSYISFEHIQILTQLV